MPVRGRGVWAFVLTIAGFAWALALFPAALLLPAYRGMTASNTGVVTQTTSTLVGENGLWVLAIVALPGVLALIAWFGLHRRCARASKLGAALAWTAIATLWLLSLLAAASVGPSLVPAGLLLAAAAWLTPSG
jgi:hypothetical protein